MNMSSKAVLFLALNFSIVGYAQFVQYAPDIRWDEEIHTYIGMANPLRDTATVTLTGYQADGTLVGQNVMTLGQFQRVEESAMTLFNTDQLAWLRMESDLELGAYVRYAHTNGKQMSMVPWIPFAGHQVMVPHIARDTAQFFTEVGLVNAGLNAGSAFSFPYVDDPEGGDQGSVRADHPRVIPGLSGPLQKNTFQYEDLYGPETRSLQWDTLFSEDGLALVGVQHFGKKATDQLAAVPLPRSALSELVISHINHDRQNFWTGLVLINTLPGILPVEIKTYMEGGFLHQDLYYEFEPFEKKTFLISQDNELGLSDIADWIMVTSYEGGLMGYEIFGSPDGRVMAALEPASKPSNMAVLPHTPSSEELWSGLGVINLGDQAIGVQIGGFDDAGTIVAVSDNHYLKPREKMIATTDNLFGELASSVSWIRVDTNLGQVSAFCLVGDRDREHLSAYQGIPNLALEGRVFLANFEHDCLEYLDEQGWTQWRFFSEYLPPERSFFLEWYYEAKNGVSHLGYEPWLVLWDGQSVPLESAAYVSPFFDIPNDERHYYLSFWLRLIDPELTREDGRYGVVWREAGADEWNWYGLTGEYLLSDDHYFDFRDAIKPVLWRQRTHNITPWLPFEVQLPDRIKGRRIQVGAYYHQSMPMADYLTRKPAPVMFIDVVQVAAEPLPYKVTLFPEGIGTFVDR